MTTQRLSMSCQGIAHPLNSSNTIAARTTHYARLQTPGHIEQADFDSCHYFRGLIRGPTLVPFLYTGNTIVALALCLPRFCIRLDFFACWVPVALVTSSISIAV